MNDTPSIFMMEDHDEAYHIWKRLGIKDATLVHIDAHIDLAWFNTASPLDLMKAESMGELKELIASVPVWNPTPDKKALSPHNGNYICSAIRDGIVERILWVVPDDFLDSDEKMRHWTKVVRQTILPVPGKRPPVTVEGRTIKTLFSGRELIVCDLASLGPLSPNLLLDIDTDFFVTDHDAGSFVELLYIKKRLPWMWPEELVDLLKKKLIRPDLVTIAYSVEQYYTPIEYKFLGDQLRDLLGDPAARNPETQAFAYLKKAVMLKSQGKLSDALDLLQQALKSGADQAAIYYHLALVQYESGFADEAKASYRQAVSLDKAYRTRYNNREELFARMGFDDKAEHEHKRMLTLDPDNAFVRIGHGETLLARERSGEAEEAFRAAVLIDAKNVRARYLLAKTLLFRDEENEARQILEGVVNDDPVHIAARLALGKICECQGAGEQAIGHFRHALRLGFCDPGLYISLARLYLRQGETGKSLRFMMRYVKLIPAVVIRRLKADREEVALKRKMAKYNEK